MRPCFVSGYGSPEVVHITTEPIAPKTHETVVLCGESFRARNLYAMPRLSGEPIFPVCKLCAETATANGIKWRGK